MLIDFKIAKKPAQFVRNPDTGRAELRWNSETLRLQSPWNPLTHLSLGTTRTWRCEVDGHEVVVSMTRARMLGGLRGNVVTIRVDGRVVADVEGR